MKVLFNKSFLIYLVIGFFAFILDYLMFLFSYKITTNPYLSNFIGVTTGILFSFSLNLKLNFKKKNQISKRFLTFVLICLLGFIGSTAIIYVALKMLIIPELAKAIAMSIICLYQFYLNKKITFK
jgi:putative flippase GtrA